MMAVMLTWAGGGGVDAQLWVASAATAHVAAAPRKTVTRNHFSCGFILLHAHSRTRYEPWWSCRRRPR